MLGSDPIYQYDNGLGGAVQRVESLEPVYHKGGGSRVWVEWFFKTIFEEPCLAFGYTQAGQENSFTWEKMKKGLEIQIPILASLSKEKKIRVETLSESGKWFREQFPVTPPTAVTTLTDHRGTGKKSVWFDSRFYRVNLLWDGPSFRFRDIHLFNEEMESDYYSKAGTTTDCVYVTLPLLDGFLWSSIDQLAGLRMMGEDRDGEIGEVGGGTPIVTEMERDILKVEWPLDGELGTLTLLFFEDRVEISCKPTRKGLSWYLEMTVAENIDLPFAKITQDKISARYRGFDYEVNCTRGSIDSGNGQVDRGVDYVFRLLPVRNIIVLNLAQKP
ncbi:MAG: hypothetical protein R6V75_01900 [Bacteroidales bacterium]